MAMFRRVSKNGDKGMKKYKVLRLVNGELISPYQNYNYGKLEDVMGKKMVCKDFDYNEYRECAKGFYATDIDGLIYSLNKNKDCRVFEVEVGGISVINSEYKQRFKEQTIVRLLPKTEVRKLIKEQSKTMDWDYYHACYPVNPLELDIPFNKDKALMLLKDWASVYDSVWYSVRASVGDLVGYSVWGSVWASVSDYVWDSVSDSVGYSVGASVGNSVGNSMGAYISSFFHIRKWKNIEHEEGVNPFQSGIDLWNMGLVPSFDGKVWRLHKGNNAEVVLEISEEELVR